MHPQLDKNRFDTCGKLMDALEECHRQEFIKQCLGMCNFEKDELTKCLHYTRTQDANNRIRETRERNKILEMKRKQREEETYGKNGYLKKMIEKEAEAKLKMQQNKDN
ncbi:cytochrome c oxidase biogenesis protein Cmc1 like-domain-containing protein [Scheffersomyces xylosifermentans]|uniref:cytochrome c oxidase biogenesis protein Cmc1 like-domain-containing protein n=1 Tax=Scheffersomyces xylosifermentans TaxID=1304137 RepID=UPI00315D99C9